MVPIIIPFLTRFWFFLIALGGSAKSIFESDSYLVQLVVVWPSPESLGGHAAHAQSHAFQRVKLYSVQGPFVEFAIPREPSFTERDPQQTLVGRKS